MDDWKACTQTSATFLQAKGRFCYLPYPPPPLYPPSRQILVLISATLFPKLTRKGGGVWEGIDRGGLRPVRVWGLSFKSFHGPVAPQ